MADKDDVYYQGDVDRLKERIKVIKDLFPLKLSEAEPKSN